MFGKRSADLRSTFAQSRAKVAAKPWVFYGAGMFTLWVLAFGLASSVNANAGRSHLAGVLFALVSSVGASTPPSKGAPPAPLTHSAVVTSSQLTSVSGPNSDGAGSDSLLVLPPSAGVVTSDLEVRLESTIKSVEASMVGRSSADVQDAVRTALEDLIIQSGAKPLQVRQALEALLRQCTYSASPRNDEEFRICPASAQSLQTLAGLLTVVVASIDAQEAPGAGASASSVSTFSAAPAPPLGTGGSNYQPI